MVTLLFASCGSDLFDKTAQAYEEATKELQDAKSDDDCDKIHDKLMQKLHDITVEYPDWEKIVREKGENSSDVQKVSEAYNKWDEALKSKASTEHYMFMTICNLPNAAGDSGKKSEASSGDSEEETSEATTSGDEDWDQILSEYEEFYNQYVEYVKKISEGDMSAYADLQEIMTKAQEIDNKVKKAKDELSEEQLEKFTELQNKLLEAAKEAGQ